MLSQSEIAYDFVAQRTDEYAHRAAALDAVRRANSGSRTSGIRLLVGKALISTGRRVQGRTTQSFSSLATAGGES
jgi:hypothetical protein